MISIKYYKMRAIALVIGETKTNQKEK